MERFKGIEPLLKQWFNIDRYTPALSNCISFSITPNQLIKTEFPEEYRNKDGNIDIHRYSFDHSDVIQVPISSDYNTGDLEQFFKDYSIEEDTIIYDILFFLYIYSDNQRKGYSTPIDEAEYDYLQYAVEVRPEMLKLYIALNSTKDADSIKIRFGNNKPVEVDTMIPWLRDELKEYLDKYLGVKSIKEAKHELLMNYTNRMGAPNNWQINQLVWGVYNLLEETGTIKAKTKRTVSRKQAKFIEEYLFAIGLINLDSKIDEHNIRSRLNSLMKNYDSIEELTENLDYKSSPNNEDGTRLY